MDDYIEKCAEVFLREQGKLFDEPVAENIDEAREFLEDCFAQVFDGLDGVRKYLAEEGMDVEDMSDEELEEQLEVFKLGDGHYFVVEA